MNDTNQSFRGGPTSGQVDAKNVKQSLFGAIIAVLVVVVLVLLASYAVKLRAGGNLTGISHLFGQLFGQTVTDPFPRHITLTTNWSAPIYTPDSRSFDWQVRGRVETFYVRDLERPEQVFTVNFGQVLDTGGVRLHQWQFRLDKPAEDIVLAYRLQ